MLRSERLARLRRTGLQDQGRALGRRLAEVGAGDFEVFADVVDFADAGGFSVDAALAVEDNSVGPPGGLPEFVGYFDIFFSDGIAIVVLVCVSKERLGYWWMDLRWVGGRSPCCGLRSRGSR